MTGLRCDTCGRRVTDVHVLPGLWTREQHVELACASCDPGGYWFPLREWYYGPPHARRRGRTYTMRRHLLESKRWGRVTVKRVEARLRDQAARPARAASLGGDSA